MKKDNIFIFIILIFQNFIIKSDKIDLSFDRLFPESNIETIQKKLINLSCLINQTNNFQQIELDFIDNLTDIYALSHLIEAKLKKNNLKNDIPDKENVSYLIKVVNYVKNILNQKFKVESINLIFDKLLNQLAKVYNHQA